MRNAHGGDYYAVVLMITAGTDHWITEATWTSGWPLQNIFKSPEFLSVPRLTYPSRLLYPSFQMTVSFTPLTAS